MPNSLRIVALTIISIYLYRLPMNPILGDQISVVIHTINDKMTVKRRNHGRNKVSDAALGGGMCCVGRSSGRVDYGASWWDGRADGTTRSKGNLFIGFYGGNVCDGCCLE